jgi:hypothetical protein
MHRIASYGEIQESNKSARHGQATSPFPLLVTELNKVALMDLGRAFEAGASLDHFSAHLERFSWIWGTRRGCAARYKGVLRGI